jgi:hypothetical protein
MDQREIISDPEEMLRCAVEDGLRNAWSCLPGIIQSYDATRGLCVVQVAVKFQQLVVDPKNPKQVTTPTWISMTPIPDVPLWILGGGSMVVECEPQNGDECLLIFADRCSDGWWSKGGVQIPPRAWMHSLSDAFALVGPRSLPNVLASKGPGLRLRTVDGTAYAELLPNGEFNITAPTGVTITVGTSVFELAPSGAITLTAPSGVKINGDLTVTGEGTFGATSIPVSTHVHFDTAFPPSIFTGGPTI